MINISAERRDGVRALHVWGHANTAAYGKDIVCAAVSVLVQTLAGMVLLCNPPNREIKLHSGNSRVVAYTNTDELDIAFVQAVLGLALVAKQYPQIVQIKTNGYFGE